MLFRSLFGSERALEVVRAHQQEPARNILEALYQRIRDFTQGAALTDDLTAIVTKAL